MSKDESTKTNIDPNEVEDAIKELNEKGFDINPFTLAEHLDCSKESLYRDKAVMDLVLKARDGDFTFKDPDKKLVSLEKTLEELEKENNNLATKIAKLESGDSGEIAPEAINDQVMQLLQSQSEEEMKSLEEELAQAYAQVGERQEEVNDLTRTVSGLEKVNEAINHRMRELEDKVKELESAKPEEKPQADGTNTEELQEQLQDLQRTVSGLERVNEAINGRMRELEDENKALKSGEGTSDATGEDNAAKEKLEAENEQLLNALKVEQDKVAEVSDQNLHLNDEVKDLKAKLVELQNDADNMAAQLQNAWHGGYEKGLAKAKEEENKVEPTGRLTDQPPEPSEETSETLPEEKTEVQAHELTQDERAVINFTQAGPYVSSDFNPLEELKWKDLETVYSMGVLSVTDINPDVPKPDQEQYVKLEGNATGEVQNNTDQESEAAPPQDKEANGTITNSEAQAGDPASMIPDFDQLDIFEDIEELEELGKIQVPDDMLADVPVDEVGSENEVVEEEKATGDDLRNLINARIKQAQEQGVEHTVRTPPAPEDSDDEEAKGFMGKNKFVGQNAKPNEGTGGGFKSPNVALKSAPREIRQACSILGISPEDLTASKVNKAWKDLIASPGVHPDQGGDTEAAVILNSAKDQLLRFIESSAPKLGKKFGGGGGGSPKDMSSRFTGKKKQ